MSDRTQAPRSTSTLRIAARHLLPAALCLVGFSAACGGEGGGRGGSGPSSTGGKGDNLGETDTDVTSGGDAIDSDHREALLACQAVADHVRENTSAARVDAIVDLERDRNDCLVTTNDGAISNLEAILTAVGDPYAGQTLPAWKSHRTTAIASCNALVEAHADAGTDALAGIAATCVGDIEWQLGTLLDAHADFGMAPFSIPGARDRYPACYDAFDDEVASAPGVDAVSESAAANGSLAACIRDVQDAAVPELAARVAATFPGRDVVTIEQDIRAAIGALTEARHRVCEVAVHAGPGRDAGGFLATIAECDVDLAIQAGDTLDLVAPGLIEGGETTGGTDGSETGGSDSTG